MEKTGNYSTDKPSQADKVVEITDRLEQGIQELFESEKYKNYLKVMSRFHNYSFNNTLLIAMQRPNATYVAGYTFWERNFGRHVKKGEKGIRILAPSPYKIEKDVEKIDPKTRKPIVGQDGQPLKERVQVTIPAYKVTTVFDIAQTEGKELPEIVTDLKEDVEDYGRFLDAIVETSPVPVEFVQMGGSIHGYFNLEDRRIAIREGMSQQQTLKTCIHETAHAILHDRDSGTEKDNMPDSHAKEVQAESVAYTVCQHFGIDTSEYSFGYVAGWSKGRELEELKASMNTIRKTAADIINSIQKNLDKAKEQTMEKVQEQAKAAGQTIILKPESKLVLEGARLRVHERHH